MPAAAAISAYGRPAVPLEQPEDPEVVGAELVPLRQCLNPLVWCQLTTIDLLG